MLEYSESLLNSELFSLLKGGRNEFPVLQDGNNSEKGLEVELQSLFELNISKHPFAILCHFLFQLFVKITL